MLKDNGSSFFIKKSAAYKVLTYIEYIAVSGVFRTIDPPPPLPLASVTVLPPTTRQAVKGWGGGQYFGRRQALDWPLTVESLYGAAYIVYA
jgi:hypothetical protein